jgi:hypothetical protein
LHRSPYGSSRHGGDDLVRYDLEPVFTRHGVDLVFAGHDHVYERTVPTRGVTYVVSGGGGRRLYPAGKGRLTACPKSAHHAVLVRVDGDNLSLEAKEPDGTVFDRFYLLRKPEGVPTERRVRIEGPDNLEAAVIEGRR